MSDKRLNWRGNPIEPTRCRATSNATGEQCRKYVAPGFTVCRFHGGSAPQVIAKARERLASQADLAVIVFQKILEDVPPCPLCGAGTYRDPVVVKAAQVVLDRVGLGPTVKLESTPSSPGHDALIDALDEEEFKIVDEIMRRAQARLAARDNELALAEDTLPPGEETQGDAVLVGEGNQESPSTAPSLPPDEEEF